MATNLRDMVINRRDMVTNRRGRAINRRGMATNPGHGYQTPGHGYQSPGHGYQIAGGTRIPIRDRVADTNLLGHGYQTPIDGAYGYQITQVRTAGIKSFQDDILITGELLDLKHIFHPYDRSGIFFSFPKDAVFAE